MNLRAKWCFHYSPKKRRYYDELDAKIALTMIQVRGNFDRGEKRYYYHRLCKGWHLTSETKHLTRKDR